MNEIVEAWVKRNNRKGAKLIEKFVVPRHPYNDPRTVIHGYKIVYQDRGKVRIGVIEDEMHVRYGICCYASMTDTSVLSLWQLEAGLVTEEDVKIMQDYLVGVCELPTFDFATVLDATP